MRPSSVRIVGRPPDNLAASERETGVGGGKHLTLPHRRASDDDDEIVDGRTTKATSSFFVPSFPNFSP